MKKTMPLTVAAVISAALTALSAAAQDDAAAAGATAAAETEKCYGVAKMGKNDCSGNNVASCAGNSEKDGDGYITVPKGLCEKLVGGNVLDPTDPLAAAKAAAAAAQAQKTPEAPKPAGEAPAQQKKSVYDQIPEAYRK